MNPSYKKGKGELRSSSTTHARQKQGKRSKTDRKQHQKTVNRIDALRVEVEQNTQRAKEATAEARVMQRETTQALGQAHQQLAKANQVLNDAYTDARRIIADAQRVADQTPPAAAQPAPLSPVDDAGAKEKARQATLNKDSVSAFFPINLYVNSNRRCDGIVRILLFGLHEQRNSYYTSLVQELSAGDLLDAGASLQDLRAIDSLMLDLGIHLTDELAQKGREANLLRAGSSLTVAEHSAQDDERLVRWIEYIKAHSL